MSLAHLYGHTHGVTLVRGVNKGGFAIGPAHFIGFFHNLKFRRGIQPHGWPCSVLQILLVHTEQ